MVSLIIVTLIIAALSVVFYQKNTQKFTYEDYTVKSKQIYDQLKIKNTVLNKNINDVYLIGYPANEEGKWSSSKDDSINNNPLLSKKREYYFEDKVSNIITKVGIYFTPNINSRDYLYVNQFDNFTNNFLSKQYNLPIIYSSNFTDKGIVIQVTTLATEQKSIKIEDEVLRANSAMAKEIQRILLDIENK